MGLPVGDTEVEVLVHPVEHRERRLELGVVFARLLDRVIARDDGITFHLLDF